jgi:hypothetical protein
LTELAKAMPFNSLAKTPRETWILAEAGDTLGA